MLFDLEIIYVNFVYNRIHQIHIWFRLFDLRIIGRQSVAIYFKRSYLDNICATHTVLISNHIKWLNLFWCGMKHSIFLATSMGEATVVALK